MFYVRILMFRQLTNKTMEISQERQEFANRPYFDDLRAKLKTGLVIAKEKKAEYPISPDKAYEIDAIFDQVIEDLACMAVDVNMMVIDVLKVIYVQDESLKEWMTEDDLSRIQDATVNAATYIKKYLENKKTKGIVLTKKDATAETTEIVRGEVKTALHLAEKTFRESISLNVLMTPGEAAEALAKFHNTSVGRILDTFINLKQAKDDQQVQFRESISNGNPCIIMEGFSRSGSGVRFWNHLINEKNGQPIARTS